MNETGQEESNLSRNDAEPYSYSDDDSFVVLHRSPSQDQFLSCIISPPNTDMHLTSANFNSDVFSMELNPEDIQRKLKEVLQENIKLKETLHQNNMALKQQLSTLRAWQDDVLKTHQTHKEKFAETKELIIKLRAENEELKNILKTQEHESKVPDTEAALRVANISLTTQVHTLQGQIAALNARNEHVMKLNSSKKEQELIALTEQLNRQLEITERSRRQMTVDIEHIQAQKTRLERDLVILNVELESYKQRTEAVEKEQIKQAQAYEPDVLRAGNDRAEIETLRKQLKEQQDIIEHVTNHHLKQAQPQNTTVKQEIDGKTEITERFSSLGSLLHLESENSNKDLVKLNSMQCEIQELKRMLMEEKASGQEKTILLAEGQEKFKNLFSDYQSLLNDWEDLNKQPNSTSMERHSVNYFEVQVRGFTDKIDGMTAKIMNLEDALAQKTREIGELQEKIQGLETENESILIMQIQMQVYQADFNAEREARECLAGEKERLSEDLRNLQRRNQQIMNELKMVQQNHLEQPNQMPQNVTNGWNTIANPCRNHPRENTPPSPGPNEF